MAWDLLLRDDTDADWSRDRKKPLELTWSPIEIRTLKLLEPSTRTHVVEVIGWARSKGIPARLFTQNIIYTPADSAKAYEDGRSGIVPGRIDWHQVGRAYHLIITDPTTKKQDRRALAQVAEYVRNRGGDWLGDKTIMSKGRPVIDLSHYEYHPDWNISTYRKLPIAQIEYQRAQARAAKYG